MAKRSPILGYNHNFRHRGLVFHVQTEDSGIDNPHIFTHLFHGGVILSSRKLTYDAGSAEEVVKALMQAQHKAMLRDLKRGTFDSKIDDYLGDNPDLEPSTATIAAGTNAKSAPPLGATLQADTDPASADIAELTSELADLADTSPSDRAPTVLDEFELDEADLEIVGGPADTLRNAPALVVATDSAPIVIEAEPSDAIPLSAGAYAQHRTGSYERVEESGPRRKSRTGTAEMVRSPRTGTHPAHLPPQAIEIAAEVEAVTPSPEPQVVVSRPSVIVGAPPKVVGEKKPPPPTPRRAREGASSLFGKDLISEKSLDEVILAYLSEDGGRDGSS